MFSKPLLTSFVLASFALQSYGAPILGEHHSSHHHHCHGVALSHVDTLTVVDVSPQGAVTITTYKEWVADQFL